MAALEQTLIENLKKLPRERMAEVADFVAFLVTREEKAAAAQRLTDALAKLDALSLPPLSDEEITAEVKAVREARRARNGQQGSN